MLWIALAIVGVTGIALTVFGWWGRRINDSPMCKRCRFNLTGLYPGSAACPECGADLAQPVAVRFGMRRKRRAVLGIGLMCLVGSGAGTGVLGWGTVNGFDWNSVKPVWLLLREASGPDLITADRALAELVKRESDGVLLNTDRARVVVRALGAQADYSRPWRFGWGDFIETAWLSGNLTEDHKRQYASQAITVSMHVRPRVRRGEVLPVSMRIERRTGSMGLLSYVLRWRGTRIGNQVLQPSTETVADRLGSATRDPSQVTVIAVSPIGGVLLFDKRFLDEAIDVEPGGSTVISRWDVSIHLWQHGAGAWHDTQMGASPAQPSEWDEDPHWADGQPSDPEGAKKFGPSVASWRQEFRADVEVLAEDAADVELILDESHRATVESIVAALSAVAQHNGHHWWAHGRIMEAETPPIDLAFDVFWRMGTHELAVGWLVLFSADHKDERQMAMYSSDLPEDVSFADTVDLVLRPSTQVARRTLGINRIWGHEIVLKDVRVKWRDLRDTDRLTTPAPAP